MIVCQEAYMYIVYSKTCFKRPLKKRQNKDFKDRTGGS